MSGKAPKQKGNRIERECVNLAKGYGFKSRRAWGSDGRSLGWHEEVDMTITIGDSIKHDLFKYLTFLYCPIPTYKQIKNTIVEGIDITVWWAKACNRFSSDSASMSYSVLAKHFRHLFALNAQLKCTQR